MLATSLVIPSHHNPNTTDTTPFSAAPVLTIALPKGRLRARVPEFAHIIEHHHHRGTVTIIELRARDIAAYVGQGNLHAGITATDLVADVNNPASTLAYTQPSPVTALHWLVPPHITTLRQLHGARIATPFPQLAVRAAADHGIDINPVAVHGATEALVHSGVAEAALEAVDTGATAARYELTPLGPPILVSRPLLIRRTEALPPAVEHTLRTLISQASTMWFLASIGKSGSRATRTAFTVASTVDPSPRPAAGGEVVFTGSREQSQP